MPNLIYLGKEQDSAISLKKAKYSKGSIFEKYLNGKNCKRSIYVGDGKIGSFSLQVVSKLIF